MKIMYKKIISLFIIITILMTLLITTSTVDSSSAGKDVYTLMDGVFFAKIDGAPEESEYWISYIDVISNQEMIQISQRAGLPVNKPFELTVNDYGVPKDVRYFLYDGGGKWLKPISDISEISEYDGCIFAVVTSFIDYRGVCIRNCYGFKIGAALIAPPTAPPEATSWEYKLVDGGVEITKYRGSVSDLIVPEILDGYTVKSIAESVFYERTELKSVKLPQGLKELSKFLFGNCRNLENIDIPDSVEIIGAYSLSGTKLKTLTLPNNLKIFGENVFSSNSSITTINIPENMGIVDFSFLHVLNAVKTINVAQGNQCYSVENNILFNNDKKTIIFYPKSNIAKSYIIPDGVEIIECYAFSYCNNLTEIKFPDSIIKINDAAFLECNSLAETKIPDGVKSIGMGAFSGCHNFINIVVPDSVETIGKRAFSNCIKLKNITLPQGLKEISEGMFAGCRLIENIIIPESVGIIGLYAFGSCERLKSLILPQGLREIHDQAFSQCFSLESINIPDSVESIGNYAFFRCISLQSITLPENTKVSRSAFEECPDLIIYKNGQEVTKPTDPPLRGNDTVVDMPGDTYFQDRKLTSHGGITFGEGFWAGCVPKTIQFAPLFSDNNLTTSTSVSFSIPDGKVLRAIYFTHIWGDDIITDVKISSDGVPDITTKIEGHFAFGNLGEAVITDWDVATKNITIEINSSYPLYCTGITRIIYGDPGDDTIKTTPPPEKAPDKIVNMPNWGYNYELSLHEGILFGEGFWTSYMPGTVSLAPFNDFETTSASASFTIPNGKVLKAIYFVNLWLPDAVVDIKISSDGIPDVTQRIEGSYPTNIKDFGIVVKTGWDVPTKDITIEINSPNGYPLCYAGLITRIVYGDPGGDDIPDDPVNIIQPQILKGDIGLNNKVNGMSLLYIKQHILDIPDKVINPIKNAAAFWAADMNDDGKINGMDLLLLKKKILG